MGIRSAKAKGIDPPIEAAIWSYRPGLVGGHNPQSQSFKINFRIAALEVEIGRQLSMPDRKRKLGQTRGAGSGFHVTEVGFDRTDPKRAIGTPTSAQCASKRICFDWITNWSAGPMGFDGSYPVRVDHAVVRSLDHRFLLRTTWHRDAGSLAVLVDRSGEETCINAIAVHQGAIQRFEKQGDRTFGPDIAVSAGIERLAAAIAGEHAG